MYKKLPTFGKLTDLARYQAKSRDKLVNHSCQFMSMNHMSNGFLQHLQ